MDTEGKGLIDSLINDLEALVNFIGEDSGVSADSIDKKMDEILFEIVGDEDLREEFLKVWTDVSDFTNLVEAETDHRLMEERRRQQVERQLGVHLREVVQKLRRLR